MPRPTDEQITAYFDQCAALIRDHGWMIQGVFPTGDEEHADLAPWPFAYTIGLAAKGYPELLMVGPYEIAGGLLNILAKHVMDSGLPYSNTNLVGGEWKYPLRIRGPIDDVAGGTPVHMARNYFAWAGSADPETLVVQQVEWPDPAGLFAEDHTGDELDVSPQLPLLEQAGA